METWHAKSSKQELQEMDLEDDSPYFGRWPRASVVKLGDK